MQLVECVPNFSEGREPAVIDAIATAVSSAEGVQLLDVDPGAATNRTVMTFVGEPEAVLEGAFRGIARAAELIDMRRHQGTHARLGACDVCPLVPVSGIDLDGCARLARELGRRVAAELGIPVYLYEAAASRPERRNLAEVRRGEYESLPARRGDPYWQPDFGSLDDCAKTGATIIGARQFLIAYNFNLNTRERRIAHDIALDIREAGRARRDRQGRILRRRDGRPRRQAGKFKHVKAVGWYLEEFGCAQVSMNLTDYRQTPLAEVFEEVCRQAERRGVRCTGSELVGLAPRECLLEAGRHFLRRAGQGTGVPERELLRVAVRSLGLNELYRFEPEKKIVEYRIAAGRPLAESSLRDFCDTLSSSSPAPGGGSTAALCGALASSLASMVAALTAGRPAFAGHHQDMCRLGERAQRLKDELLQAVDDDTAAFERVMEALRLPRDTADERRQRRQALQQATRGAVRVPLAVLQHCREVIRLVEQAARHGNPNAHCDAGVGAACARAAAAGALLNVLVNLGELDDEAFREKTRRRATRLADEVERRAGRVFERLRRRLG
ncbi:MAG: glutamate formimidoyltransferase [Deltaproteobacteria bacterium]|nr:MAG: glutamate formimidoyltransferase [Deltaproteobacteria bacterium]